MRLPQTGGCQCGKLRYEITQAPHMIYTCHCTNCQRFTSSAFSLAVLVDAQAFHLTGEPRAMLHTADSGSNVSRWGCPECGSWICSGKSASPFRNVRAGTLDDTSWLRPTVHFWTRSKQPWVVLPARCGRARGCATGFGGGSLNFQVVDRGPDRLPPLALEREHAFEAGYVLVAAKAG